MEFKVRAGRFAFDRETQKVKVSKDKGLIHVQRNEEGETHFKWANLETHEQEIDLIVFASDAVFEPVVGKNNTFVLRFGMDEDRYFFWLQEKTDHQAVVTEINRLINYEQPESEMVDEASEGPRPETRPEAASTADRQQANPVPASTIANLIRQFQRKETAITHMAEVVTPEALSQVISNFDEEEKSRLLEFMPEEMRDTKYIASNLRSPQFQQALDVLSDALNSENSIPIFMEMGLDRKFLEQHMGVEAFLMALMDWAKKGGN